MGENGSCKSVFFKRDNQIDNPCEVVVVVNPKDYNEHLEDFRCKKNHKGIRKGAPSMNFENFVKRVVSAHETEDLGNPENEYQEQQTLSVEFSQTNDKRFYSPNGMTSLLI